MNDTGNEHMGNSKLAALVAALQEGKAAAEKVAVVLSEVPAADLREWFNRSGASGWDITPPHLNGASVQPSYWRGHDGGAAWTLQLPTNARVVFMVEWSEEEAPAYAHPQGELFSCGNGDAA